MKYNLLILLFFPLTVFSQNSGSQIPGAMNTDSILNILEQELAQKDIYVEKKLRAIDNFKQVLRESDDVNEKYVACWHIVNEYKSFQYDSAFLYSIKLSDLGHQIGTSELIQTARLKTAFVLESGGLFQEATDTLEVVDLANAPDSIRSEYYSVATRLCDFLAYYVKDAYYARIYQQRSREYMMKELEMLPTSSVRSYFIQIQLSQSERDFEETERLYQTMVESFQLTDHQLAMRSYDMGVVFSESAPEKALYYKALSAIHDIRAAVKENVSMRELAEALYKQGDLRRSTLFIRQSLDDANFYSSRLRKVEVSDILPIIEGKQYEELAGKNDRVTTYSYIITALVLILGLSLFIIFRQLKKLRASQRSLDQANETLFSTNLKLEESNKIKEAYIGQFFNVISEHLFKTEKLVTSINRKLSQRKFDDLAEVTDSINLFKERELLYKDFDEMFLALFPDFIQKMNVLLKPEEQLDPAINLLPPEIRIYALMRLGITDNNQIARFLNYSINTIYTYKTRLKNKVVDPETFEESIVVI